LTPPASGDVLGRVTVANLNVRSQSNSTSAVLFKLNKGEYVQVNNINGYWAEITYNGQTGYVHKSYLKLTFAEDVGFTYKLTAFFVVTSFSTVPNALPSASTNSAYCL